MIEVALSGDANSWDLPVLRMDLRRDGRAIGSMQVRFPEHIDAWHDGQALRVYRDSRAPRWATTLACAPVELPVRWAGSTTRLGYTMPFDNGMVFKTEARAEPGSASFALELDNGTDMDLEDVKVDCCFQTLRVPDVCDKTGERLVMPVAGRFQPVRALIPELAGADIDDGNAHRFYGYRPGPRKSRENLVVTPGPPGDPDSAVYRWTAPGDIDASVIAILSRDGDWAIATSSDNASPVWSNPDLSCMHASPTTAFCRAGETAKLSIHTHFIEGSLEALAERFL